MRFLLWIIGIPIFLIVTAMIVLPMVLDARALVDLAAAEIESQTGVVLDVKGDAAFTLFPEVSLSANEISVKVPDTQIKMSAQSISAGVALLPLLGSNVEIESVLVDELTLITEANDGEAAKAAAVDTSTLSDEELDAFYAARARLRAEAQAEAAASVVLVAGALEVGELALRDIKAITVDGNGDAISELRLLELTAKDLNTRGRPAPLTAHVLVPGQDGAEDINVILNGKVTSDLSDQTVNLDGMNVAITGATQDPIALTLSGDVELTEQVARMDIALTTGELQGEGSLRYAGFESPQIDATLDLTELNPALLVLAGPEAAAAAETAEASGGDALPLHAIRMIDTRAQLTIDKVVVDPHTLTDVTATLRVVDGVATLEPVKAKIYGGDINFKARFDGHYNSAMVVTSGGVESIDVGQAVAAMDAGIEAAGVANLSWNLSGQGRSSSALTETLAGPINFTTDDITLKGIAMEQMVCNGVALVNQESLTAEFPQDTRFTALAADIALAGGVATLQPLTAQLPALALSGNGELALESQDLRASFRAQLSPDLELMDPACRINERYTDLRWPVECKGNLASDPAGWCGINTAEIVKDLAEGELKRKVSEKAGKFLNKLFESDG
ncbi:MAG: AsmA family protein [Pseudomonadota bacterium]